MRVILELELEESEVNHARDVTAILQPVCDSLSAKWVTDKNALSTQICEMVQQGQMDNALAEIRRRLSSQLGCDDCIDAVASLLFDPKRVSRGESILPYASLLKCMPEPEKSKLRDEVLQRVFAFLSQPRRLDCSREPLLPYAEVFAAYVKINFISVRNALLILSQMVLIDATRCAGITCIGKLVEIAYDEVMEICEPKLLDDLRGALDHAQRTDAFIYDIEYIMEAFGWSQMQGEKSSLTLTHSKNLHQSPILSLSYSSGLNNGRREYIITSAQDSLIGIWDASGAIVDRIVLSRHYATCLDVFHYGRAFVAGLVERQASTGHAVVIMYTDEDGWKEVAAVEPEGARVVTSIKSARMSSPNSWPFFCTTAGVRNSLHYYDSFTRIREFSDHHDVISALCVTSENTVVTGSRDCSLLLYDLRMGASTCTPFGNHNNTVTALYSVGEYVFSGGIDKRIIGHDIRMLSQQVVLRELDSAVLSLSVTPQWACAVSTLTGIQILNLTLENATCRAEHGLLPCNYNTISWNSQCNMLYAGGETGTLDIFTSEKEFR